MMTNIYHLYSDNKKKNKKKTNKKTKKKKKKKKKKTNKKKPIIDMKLYKSLAIFISDISNVYNTQQHYFFTISILFVTL